MSKDSLILVNRAPLLPVLFSVTVGILAATANDWIGGCIVTGIILAGLLLLLKKEVFLFISLVGGSLAGCIIVTVDDYINRCTVPEQVKCDATGTVNRISESEHSFRLLLNLEGNFRGTCYLTVINPDYKLAVGDIIKINTTFRPPIVRKDESDQETLDRFYYLNHVGCTALVNGSHIDVIGKNKSLKYRLTGLRESIVDMIAGTSLSPHAQGFLATLLVGDDSMLFDGGREKFASAGVAHVLALSGMHVAVLVMVAAWVMLPFSIMGYHRLRWFLIIVLMWLYAMITGLSPSVVRAVVMFTLIIFARYLGYRHSSLNALCFAALLILVVTPRALFTAGYQLTFIATASLICVPVICGVDLKNQGRGILGKLQRWMWYYVIFTIAATAGTLLLSVYWFHKIPLYFLLTNIPCAILLPPVLVLGLTIIALQAIGADWSFLISTEDCLCSIIDWTVELNRLAPGHVIEGIYLSPAAVVLGYIALLIAMVSVYYKKKVIASVALISIIVILIYPFTREKSDRLFIARSSSASTVIYTQDREAYCFTTATMPDKTGLEEHLLSYYRKFFDTRGIRNLHLLNSGEMHNGLLRVGRYSILVINDNDFLPVDVAPDYILVGGGFKGDIVELAQKVPADTILLGTDINGIRRKRYFRELNDTGCAVRDLRDDYGLQLELN
ncbi:MAG: ComEC/Rec2 family competence protein [Muribaculaceae bacterium]|nr:ComEC/Rec2 family competence protein [Muribaculaceae bacterium]